MIKLSQVRDALYDVSMETSCYFNIKTNEILWHFDFNEEDQHILKRMNLMMILSVCLTSIQKMIMILCKTSLVI